MAGGSGLEAAVQALSYIHSADDFRSGKPLLLSGKGREVRDENHPQWIESIVDEIRLWMKCFVADDESSAVGLLPVALRAEHLAVIGNSPSALGPRCDVVGLHVLVVEMVAALRTDAVLLLVG